MTYCLGIDVGTTYTAAAVARDGRAEMVALGYRATSVPTVVALTEERVFVVGDAAEPARGRRRGKGGAPPGDRRDDPGGAARARGRGPARAHRDGGADHAAP